MQLTLEDLKKHPLNKDMYNKKLAEYRTKHKYC